MGFPSLNYTNYLHVFTSSAPSGKPSGASYGLTFTATKDCYLVGHVYSNTTLSINDVPIAKSHNGGGSVWENGGTPAMLKLTRGDTVSVTASTEMLHVFAEK